MGWRTRLNMPSVMSDWSSPGVTAIRQSFPIRDQHLIVPARHATASSAAARRSQG